MLLPSGFSFVVLTAVNATAMRIQLERQEFPPRSRPQGGGFAFLRLDFKQPRGANFTTTLNPNQL